MEAAGKKSRDSSEFFQISFKCLGKELPPHKNVCRKNVCYNILLDMWVVVFLVSSCKK